MRREMINNLLTLIPETDAEAALTAFERRLADVLLKSISIDSQRNSAQLQLATATVAQRSFSNIGFFVEVAEGGPVLPSNPMIRSGLGSAWITGPGLKTGATAFFLADEGRITCIEAVTFDASDWPADDAIRYLLDAEPLAQIVRGGDPF